MQKNHILNVLSLKGLTMGDLKYGDNIGHKNGKDVVYDLKSLKNSLIIIKKNFIILYIIKLKNEKIYL